MRTTSLLENAEIWCWGDNNEGQLGQADEFLGDSSRETDALSPVRVPNGASSDGGLRGWKFVDVGEGHSCGLQADDSLWCWGRNSEGQIGVRTDVAQHRLPILITPGPRWSLVDVAQNYTCALDGDRAVWCWGHNQGLRSETGNPFGFEAIDLLDPTRVGDGPWVDFSTNWATTSEALAPKQRTALLEQALEDSRALLDDDLYARYRAALERGMIEAVLSQPMPMF
jgi:alpha-tubulin suppressor-like RCC1 family protein